MRNIRDCNVCVVGGAGFLGSHAVDHLINDRQCDLLVIDNLVAGRREFVHPKAKFVHADITHSENYLHDLFRKYKIQYVLNYAAHPYVPDSFDRPMHVCQTNFNGAINVINAAQETGCKGILQISSAEIYGGKHIQSAFMEDGSNSHYLGAYGPIKKFDENTPVDPHSSYGVSKSAVDAYVQVRWREAKTPCIALRQFNCLGERDLMHPYVVPAIISQLHVESYKGGEDDTVIGTVKLGNNSTRDFMYAGDQARMAVELLEKGQFGDCYNLGSESCIKIYDLAKLIGNIMGFKNVEIMEDESRKRPYEIWHLQSDNAKIYSVIESRPKVGLEEALTRTINDFKERGGRWGW